jgi:putative sterol carrier protein
VHPGARPLEGEDALGELDAHVDLAILAVPVGTGHHVDGAGLAGRVPLDVEGDRHRQAVGAAPRLGGVVEQHAVCLVAHAPLHERAVAVVPGPHLGRLHVQAVAQAGAVELLDVEVRLTFTHEARPVVEPATAEFEPDRDAGDPIIGESARTPEPPGFHRGVGMAQLVGIGPHRGKGTGPPIGQTGTVVRYLSLDWIDALTAEVAANTTLAELAGTHAIGVTQVVTGGPEGDVVYHLQVGDGSASFGAGAAFPEDVRMEQSWDTAIGVATGTMNAQDAFIGGHIRLTGDQQKLVASQPVFAALDAVFSSVRDRTEYH